MDRYPLGALVEKMRMSHDAACRALGVRYDTPRGLTYWRADELATKAGYHPFEVWPEMAQIEETTCPGCGTGFVPVIDHQVHCTKACGRRASSRNRRAQARDLVSA